MLCVNLIEYFSAKSSDILSCWTQSCLLDHDKKQEENALEMQKVLMQKAILHGQVFFSVTFCYYIHRKI